MSRLADGAGAAAAVVAAGAAGLVSCAEAACLAQRKLREHGHGYCQILMSNSGCSLPVESLICSSMYFGSVPLSNFTVAPRL